MLSAAVNSS